MMPPPPSTTLDGSSAASDVYKSQHCAPCPKGIDVANVTKFLNLAKAQGEVPETVREHYAALKAHAGDCIACGACAKRCPFAVDPVANMKEAKEVFGY